MQEPTPASVHTGMLVRRPVHEVFQAFVDPSVTTNFWFSRSTGPLEPGKTVTWFWEMHGVQGDVHCLKLDPNRRILIDWGTPDNPEQVEWTFTEIPGTGTFVRIVTTPYQGSPNEVLQQLQDNVGGFTLVLAGLKAWLEHNIHLNLVTDRFPKEAEER